MKRIIAGLLLLTAAGWVFGSDTTLFQEAEGRFASGDYELAADFYAELLTDYPQSRFVPAARFRTAQSLYYRELWNDSLAEFRQVELRYRYFEDLAEIPYWAGMILFRQETWQDAVTEFNRYLSGNDDGSTYYASVLLRKSQALLELGEEEQAAESLQDYLGTLSNMTDDSYALGMQFSLLTNQENYEDLIFLYDNLEVADLPESDRYRLMLYTEEALWETGKTERAESLAVELKDAPAEISAIAYQRLFQIAQQSGDEEALSSVVTEAERALSGLPDVLMEFWLRIGMESYRSDEPALAKSYLQRVWALRFTQNIRGVAAVYFAQIEYENGNISRAIDILSEYQTLGDLDLDLVTLKLGVFYHETARWQESIDQLSTLLEGYPESPYYSEAGYYLAFSYYRNDDYQDSLDVISDLFANEREGDYRTVLLRIRSTAQISLGDDESALMTLQEYLADNSDDSSARIDKIRILFKMNRFQAVIADGEELLDDFPALAAEVPDEYIMVQYLLGASQVSRGNFSEAYSALELLDKTSVEAQDLGEIYPYILYYRGWSLYRLSDENYEEAARQFAEVESDYSGHALAVQASYLAGWCRFVNRDFALARSHFEKASAVPDGTDLYYRSLILKGKSLFGQGLESRASVVFDDFYRAYPDSDYADDALFERANVLASMGQIDASVEVFSTLFTEYSGSSLADDGLYRRAEVYYEQERFEAAANAFYDYRTHYSNGELVDASLYWGGLALNQTGQDLAALLLWDKLSTGYRDSPFRSDALLRSARLREEEGKYREALTLYSEVVAYYPELAEINQLAEKTEELRYILLGLDETEASLSARISAAGGSSSAEGRAAMLELSRIYISENGSKENLAVSMLEEIKGVSSQDPASAAEAAFLLGDYYVVEGDTSTAAQNYILAAGYDADDETSAAALYQAARLAAADDRSGEAYTLVDQLRTRYATSPWTAEAQTLLEDLQ